MGKKARIKRLKVEAERLDQIGEAYIHASGQLMEGTALVILFDCVVTSHAEATLTLHDELERQKLRPEDLLQIMKRKHQQALPEFV